MFYDVVVNDWGETTYVPTLLGNVCLAAVIVVLLGLALVFIKRRQSKENKPNKGKMTVKQIAFCAVAVALGTILSNIKLLDMPTGGSVTLLFMLVACLPGYWFGLGAGLMTGVACGVLQMLFDPYILYPFQMLLDYPLAFGALGLAGLFSNSKNGLIKGYLLGITGRYICSTLSGWIFFGMYAWEGWNPLAYSLAYNAIVIYAEGAITLIIILLPPVKKALGRIKTLALE